MARSQRTDPLKELGHLETRHHRLKERVALYESQRFLTSSEQVSLVRLKKEKLATKDAIENIRTAIG